MTTKKRTLRYPVFDDEYVYEVAVNFDTSNSNRKPKVLFVKCKSKPHKTKEEVTYKVEGDEAVARDTEDALRFLFPHTCKFSRA